LNDYVNEFGSGVQGMIDTIVDSGNFSAIAESLYAALEKEAAGFKEDNDELQINFNNLALGNDEIIDAEEGFLKNKEDLINLYGDELDAIEEVINAVEELMKTYNAAEKAAIDATTAAYNYQKTDMSNAAAASPNPVSRRADATEAEQSAVQATAAQQFKTVMDEYSKTTSSFDQISNKIKEDIADVAADAYVPAAAASPILSA
jgi:chemotaxis protein histidine kinase CheA